MTDADQQDSGLIRATVLDVVRERPTAPIAQAAAVEAYGVDADGPGRPPIRRVEFHARIDGDGRLAAIDGAVGIPPDLIGRDVGRGFRTALEPLRTAGPAGRLLRRLLWDLPILARVSAQTALLDHAAARANVQLGLGGTDQCSGWRAGGQMLRQVEAAEGILHMPLGPPWQERSAAERLVGDVRDLPPMATRRARLLRVGPPGATGRPVEAEYRDSYTDPDGVRRALHEWDIRATLDGPDGDARLTAVTATAGRLPWDECPLAGGSATRLDGVPAARVEQALGRDFSGIGTCTHLTDTLRALADLPDLVGAVVPES